MEVCYLNAFNTNCVRSFVSHVTFHRYLKRVLPEQHDASETAGPPRKKQRGQNKNRPRDKRVPPGERLCPSVKVNQTCSFGEGCHFSHDVAAYMAKKPSDIGERCVLFELYGECPYGLECRFGKPHISSNFKNIKQEDSGERKNCGVTYSWLSKELQEQLHKKTVKFPRSEKYLSKSNSTKETSCEPNDSSNASVDSKEEMCKKLGPVSDEDIVKLRASEKKTVQTPIKNLLIGLSCNDSRLILEANFILLH